MPFQRSIRRILFVLVVAMACGCATSTRIRTDDNPSLALAPVPPAVVSIHSGEDIGRPYDILGLVVACMDGFADPGKLYELVRREAATLGADAVVDTRMDVAIGSWTLGARLSGVAVRVRAR